MIRSLVFLLCILFSIAIRAQEAPSTNAFKFNSISLSLGIYEDGFTGSIDLSFKKGTHLFKTLILGSQELAILSTPNDSQEFDLLYGRALKIKKWLFTDIYGGLGYFRYKKKEVGNPRNHVQNQTIGFPIQARIRFQMGKVAGAGLQLHMNFNSKNSIYALGPFFQWTF